MIFKSLLAIGIISFANLRALLSRSDDIDIYIYIYIYIYINFFILIWVSKE